MRERWPTSRPSHHFSTRVEPDKCSTIACRFRPDTSATTGACDQTAPSNYLVEAGAITHQPFTGPKGLILLGFMFGPIGGFDAAGNLAGVLDIDWHSQTAKANGAAGHTVRRSMAAAPAH